MANWCSNWVIFQGDEKTLSNIQELFSAMKMREDETGHGQLPEFAGPDDRHFFNIYFEQDNPGVFQYETRWAPNTGALLAIARQYNAGFVQDYEESVCMVYGQATFADGVLSDTCLDGADFDAYEYDEEQDAYLFEGVAYESSSEILETLLERKMAIKNIEVQADENL